MRCWQVGKTFTKTLHASTFLIYRHHQMIASGRRISAHQFTQL
ncbi:hypothetical protein ACNKHT_07305 [Shigella flexneri]